MRRAILAVIYFTIFIITILISGCSGHRNLGLHTGQKPSVVNPVPAGEGDSFPAVLDEFMSMPDPVREDLKERALTHLAGWEQFEKEAAQNRDSGLRHWFYAGTYLDRETWGVGLGNSISDLKAATGLDPSFAAAWGALGRLCSAAGDLNKAHEYLDRAREAIKVRGQAGDPVDDDIQLAIYKDRAWVLRDLGLWEKGLAAVTEGLLLKRGDRDLVLIKGLLLAGAGRYEEATSLAVRMKPFSYPQIDFFHYGTRKQTSDFANRWIRSQALMAVGDYQTARHVIGEMGNYPYRLFLPHQQRFWNDVGLVAELAGDEEAGVYYAIGFISSPYGGYFSWMAGNLEPLVLDVPKAEIPYFTSFGGRFHVGGSILSYAAHQMNLMTMSVFENQRSLAAWRSLQALNIAERRNIRPNVVRAMRGRVYFSVDDHALAQRDLASARNGFNLQGKVDAGTSLLLGLLELNEEHFAQAVPLLEEAVTKDAKLAVGWRSLGVSLVRLGQIEQAERAMDRSLQLEPGSVSGLYNRGLLHLQKKDFSQATADLDRAFRLDPENHEVQRLLQMAAAGHRAAGGDPGEIRMLTENLASSASELPQMTPEQIMAGLEADIEAFFAVPDSVRNLIGPKDQVIISLEAQLGQTQDPMVRKILALAYMDRKMYPNAQALLAPGWGVDLSPEEELMLLYIDRLLGEEQRSSDLADLLLASGESRHNPYLLMMLPKEHRKHWTQTMVANNHYFEGYGAARIMSLGDQKNMQVYMTYNFDRVRQASQGGSPITLGDIPFFRLQADQESGANSHAPSPGNRADTRSQMGAMKK